MSCKASAAASVFVLDVLWPWTDRGPFAPRPGEPSLLASGALSAELPAGDERQPVVSVRKDETHRKELMVKAKHTIVFLL